MTIIRLTLGFGTIQKPPLSVGGGVLRHKRTIHMKVKIFPIKKTNKREGGQKVGQTYFLNGRPVHLKVAALMLS